MVIFFTSKACLRFIKLHGEGYRQNKIHSCFYTKVVSQAVARHRRCV